VQIAYLPEQAAAAISSKRLSSEATLSNITKPSNGEEIQKVEQCQI
jgi:hypothetical protein